MGTSAPTQIKGIRNINIFRGEIKMKEVGYYNGKIGPLEEMTVPMEDRALYFGDGIYEATCVANRVPFALDDHLDRMYNSLRLLEIPFHMERDQVKAELQKVIDAAEESPVQFLYWQISRGVCMRNHPFPDPEKSMDKPYKLISMEDIRFKLCNIKTLNLIPSVLANQRAVERGCDEAVLHRGSRVTECAHSNISMLKDGVLHTAPTDELILPGITRKHLLQLAREHDIPVVEKPFSMVELMNADEVIVTSSSALCMKAESIGMLPIYTGVKGEENQGLATGSENYWCINSKASDADKQATKDFLKWVVTSKTGIESLSSAMGFTTPFKSFSDVKSDNPLVQAAVEDQNSGKTAVSWNFTMMPSEEWKNQLGSALLEYAQGTGDWNAVKTAFVDGWKTEYDAAH